jgi:hypothetical protein
MLFSCLGRLSVTRSIYGAGTEILQMVVGGWGVLNVEAMFGSERRQQVVQLIMLLLQPS